MSRPVIVWFQNDLRLQDNRCLSAAASKQVPVVPLFIWSPEDDANWPPGGASRWWLHHSLVSLGESLARTGSQLLVMKGSNALDCLKQAIKATNASSVFWNRRYEPAIINRDKDIEKELANIGIAAHKFNNSLLFEPSDIATKTGEPYKVFTPFWRACKSAPQTPSCPVVSPEQLNSNKHALSSLSIDELGLLPDVKWDSGIREFWSPGEAGAQLRLQRFIEKALRDYSSGRDRPGDNGVSFLSPHLHFGEISPRQIWHAVMAELKQSTDDTRDASAQTYLKELGWREFAHHILYHFPETIERPLRDNFNKFPWSSNASALQAWQKGQTGYPIVDAGMRQLWKTGWMHNRVRMIVASFLTKDLLISWQEGARWFWDTLVDADLASNTFGWQWTAGCGADAAPYFRIFNPVLQGKKFDPDGAYVRKWVPELKELPPNHIHSPWQAPEPVLLAAGVRLGSTYPKPIVDHSAARARALDSFQLIKA